MPTVLVTDSLARPGEGGGIGLLENAGLELRFQSFPRDSPAAELISHLQGCFAVLAAGHRYTEEVFAALPELCVVARLGVGFDAIDLAAATRRGVCITTTPGALEWAVADHTMGLILNLAHHIGQDDRAIRRGEWRQFYGLDVTGKTLGLVGLGRIGQLVAQRARGFDMRILAHEPRPDPAFVERHGIELVLLDHLLAQSDFVSLHLPLTPQSTRLLNSERLALMKPGAYLINTARGGLIDEDALFDALQGGRLGGAGLDVRDPEPPHDPRFSNLENIVLTPHVAGLTDGRWLACGAMAATGILRVLRGERPDGLVNAEVWESPARRTYRGT
ncbi:MAG TPA: phosphoglycerate dehydrogenase [Chloroflexota bacterium]|nr:phosphoglycerate dehydrogenase [Chloroflexota bacterium]